MITHILNVWTAELPGDSPCGEDMAFSPEFEALKNEVEKDTSLHSGGGTDWEAVRNMTADVLSTRSKDLWVLVYALQAVYRIDGLAEYPEALACLNDILEKHWDELYPLPNRMQRRMAPLQWLQTRLMHSADGTGFSGEKPEVVALLKAQIIRLQTFLEAKSEDHAPTFTAVFNNSTSTTEASDEHDAEGESTPVVPAASSLTPSLTRMDADGRVPSAVLPQLVRNVMEQTRQLAGHFLSLNPLDERAYQLHRTALWSTLLYLPPADNAGLTQMSSGVPADKAQSYVAALEGRQYEQVLPFLERSAAKSPFWLDGHYMVARCLEALGATVAHNCVKNMLAQLLTRFPELPTYKFKNNEPFASPKVVPWLETIQPSSIAPVHGIAGRSPSADANEEEARLQEAVALCMEEDFQSGLRRLGSVPPGRCRAAVQHGLLLARYCLAVGKKTAALRVLQELYRQMEQWNLLDWEPELSARIIVLLLSVPAGPRGADAEELSRRLHWLSLDTAVGVLQET